MQAGLCQRGGLFKVLRHIVREFQPVFRQRLLALCPLHLAGDEDLLRVLRQRRGFEFLHHLLHTHFKFVHRQHLRQIHSDKGVADVVFGFQIEVPAHDLTQKSRARQHGGKDLDHDGEAVALVRCHWKKVRVVREAGRIRRRQALGVN